MEYLARRGEEAANRLEQGQVYKITMLVSGKYHGATDTPIVNKQGRLEPTWAGHFSDVRSRPPPTIEEELQDPHTGLDVSAAPPEKKEIMKAIKIP